MFIKVLLTIILSGRGLRCNPQSCSNSQEFQQGTSTGTSANMINIGQFEENFTNSSMAGENDYDIPRKKYPEEPTHFSNFVPRVNRRGNYKIPNSSSCPELYSSSIPQGINRFHEKMSKSPPTPKPRRFKRFKEVYENIDCNPLNSTKSATSRGKGPNTLQKQNEEFKKSVGDNSGKENKDENGYVDMNACANDRVCSKTHGCFQENANKKTGYNDTDEHEYEYLDDIKYCIDNRKTSISPNSGSYSKHTKTLAPVCSDRRKWNRRALKKIKEELSKHPEKYMKLSEGKYDSISQQSEPGKEKKSILKKFLDKTKGLMKKRKKSYDISRQ